MALNSAPHDHEFYNWGMYWQNVGEKKYDEALKILETAPGEWIRHKLYARPKSLLTALVYYAQGKKEGINSLLEESKILLKNKITEWPDDPRYHSSLGITYAMLGKKSDAIREGIKATELLPISKNAEYGISYEQDLAMIYALSGETDNAIKQLEYLLKINSWVSIPYIKMIPAYDVLKDQPKFKELLKKYSVN
jgi:tetratricopeptide (TPR) repeat protein